MRCVKDGQNLLTLPIAWTSYRRPDDFERVSEGQSSWRADDLEALRAAVDSLAEREGNHDQK